MIACASNDSALAADLDHILTHTEQAWEALRGKAILITGGTGFFGRWLLESFVAANQQLSLGARAVVLTRQPQRFRGKAPHLAGDDAVRLVEGDVRNLDADSVRSQLGPFAPDQFTHCIHAASETGEPANRDRPAAVLETLFQGTRRTLEFAERTGVQHLLLVSSGAVYGEQPASVSHLPENHSGAPDVSATLSAYGEGKRVAELLCLAHSRSHPMNCKIARCFAFVGPHLPLDSHYAIGNFIRDLLQAKPIRVNGDGTPLRSYLYAADLAVWLWTLLLDPRARGIYNVGSDEAYSIGEIAGQVARQHPQPLAVKVAQPPQAGRAPARYVPDIQRARRELGLQVWTPLDAAIRQTIQFHQPPAHTI